MAGLRPSPHWSPQTLFCSCQESPRPRRERGPAGRDPGDASPAGGQREGQVPGIPVRGLRQEKWSLKERPPRTQAGGGEGPAPIWVLGLPTPTPKQGCEPIRGRGFLGGWNFSQGAKQRCCRSSSKKQSAHSRGPGKKPSALARAAASRGPGRGSSGLVERLGGTWVATRRNLGMQRGDGVPRGPPGSLVSLGEQQPSGRGGG